MNKPSRDRFFPVRTTCYKLIVTGEGVKPIRDNKVMIMTIDFSHVSFIDKGSEDGYTMFGLGNDLFEVKLDISILKDAYVRYKNTLL